MSTRILHVVGGMNRGGVETWLMHVLRHIDRSRFQMDFLVHTEQACAYDDEIRALGSRIIPCLHPSQPLRYARNFSRILRNDGPYDVVHSHVHHFSGYVLCLASQASVPIRIAHSHLNTTSLQASATNPRRLYLELTRWLIGRYATVGLGASRAACAALYGEQWQHDPRWQLLYCSIDLTPFEMPIDRAQVRAELGIPEDAFVVGHVGRFAEQKNHRFIIQIAEELVRRKPETRFLLVGDGPLRPEIERQAHQANVTEHVIFAGLRDDVPRLMTGAMDVFLMPSLYEGLPVALIEAQSAGLPCVISDVISPEIQIFPFLFSRLPLSNEANIWAQVIMDFKTLNPKCSMDETFSIIRNSAFNIQASLKQIEAVYCG